MIDVLHVIGAFVSGGAEKFVSDLSTRMVFAGMKVGIYALSGRTDVAGAAMRRSTEMGGVLVRDSGRSRAGWSAVRGLRNAVEELKPAVIHVHTENTVVALLLSAIPWTTEANLVNTVHTTKANSSLLWQIARHLISFDSTIACGEGVLPAAQMFRTQHRICIPNGVMLPEFERDSRTYEMARRKLDVGQGSTLVVCVGRMGGASVVELQKAQDVLIQAWRMSRHASNAQSLLMFLGDGNQRQALEQLAAGTRNIKFLGVQSNIDEWLTAADIFAMPSRWEGRPIAALEAACVGVPMVLSDIPELDTLDFSFTKRFRGQDVMALCSALNEIPGAPVFISSEEIKKVHQECGMDQTVERYRAVYAR